MGSFALNPDAPGARTTTGPLEPPKAPDEEREPERLFSRCRVCDRPLKSQDSMRAGMGPVCAGKRVHR